MKAFKSPQRVTIVFLTLFIMLCCFLIVRLEIKAANLQSQWDEHQKSLKINEDQLYDLDQFRRNIKNGPQIQLLPEIIWLYIDGASLELKKNTMKGYSNGDISFGKGKSSYFGYDSDSKTTFMRGVKNGNVFIRSKSGDNYIRITDDMVSLDTEDKNKRTIGLSLTPSSGRVDIYSGGNRANIWLEQEDIFMSCENEISFKGKNLQMVNASGKLKIIMGEDNIQLICTPSKGPIFGVSFSPSVQSININTHNASINLEKDVIHFEADGDINITSKNGNVNIRGKKVKVNE